MTRLEKSLNTSVHIAEQIKFHETEDNYSLANRLRIDVEKATTLIYSSCRILIDVRDELKARVNSNKWLELEYKQQDPDEMTDEEGSLEALHILDDTMINIDGLLFDEEESSPVLLADEINDLLSIIKNMKKVANDT